MLEGRTGTLTNFAFESEGLSCLAAGIEDSNRVANKFWWQLALAMMPPAILNCGTMVAIILCLLLARKIQKDRDARLKTHLNIVVLVGRKRGDRCCIARAAAVLVQ